MDEEFVREGDVRGSIQKQTQSFNSKPLTEETSECTTVELS